MGISNQENLCVHELLFGSMPTLLISALGRFFPRYKGWCMIHRPEMYIEDKNSIKYPKATSISSMDPHYTQTISSKWYQSNIGHNWDLFGMVSFDDEIYSHATEMYANCGSHGKLDGGLVGGWHGLLDLRTPNKCLKFTTRYTIVRLYPFQPTPHLNIATSKLEHLCTSSWSP
jgi:hypothetical protein